MIDETSHFRIRDWQRLYEPKRETRGEGPLEFVKWRVKPEGGIDYDHLRDAAGDELAATLGVFGKLLEMAAGEPKNRRDGTVWNHRHEPATIPEVAYAMKVPAAVVARSIEHLTAAAWIEPRPAGPEMDAESPSGPQEAPARPDAPGCAAKDKDLKLKHEGKDKPEPDQDQGGVPGDPKSESDQGGGHRGVQDAVRMKLMDLLGIREPHSEDKTSRAKQARGDITCLRRIVRHVINAEERERAKGQSSWLLQLGQEMGERRNGDRMKAFMGEAKKRWPGLAREFGDR